MLIDLLAALGLCSLGCSVLFMTIVAIAYIAEERKLRKMSERRARIHREILARKVECDEKYYQELERRFFGD